MKKFALSFKHPISKKLFLYTFTYGFIFGCAGSLSLPGLFSSAGERGYSLVVAHSVPTAVASRVTEHRLQSAGSTAVAHRRSCFLTCGIFLNQGSHPCLSLALAGGFFSSEP